MEYKEIRWKTFQILRKEKQEKKLQKRERSTQEEGEINKKGEKRKSEGVKAQTERKRSKLKLEERMGDLEVRSDFKT